MWSHYADKHRGIVLEIETDQLQRGMDLSTGIFEVRYRTSPPAMSALENSEDVQLARMLEVMSTKAIHWSYEEEVRVLFPLQDEPKNAEPRELDFDPMCIKSVIVGCYDDPVFHTYKVVDELAEHLDYRQTRFQRAYVHPHDYKLCFADRPLRAHS